MRRTREDDVQLSTEMNFSKDRSHLDVSSKNEKRREKITVVKSERFKLTLSKEALLTSQRPHASVRLRALVFPRTNYKFSSIVRL